MSQHTQSTLYAFDLSSSFNHDHKPATLQPVDLTVEVTCVYVCVCVCVYVHMWHMCVHNCTSVYSVFGDQLFSISSYSIYREESQS